MTTRTERLEAALRNLVGWAESVERRAGVRMGDANTGALVAAQDVLAESGPSCCEETRERTRTECEDAAVEALVQTRDNERKAISKGGPSYSPNFRHIALVDNVATAIRALSNQAPPMSLDDSDYVHPGSGRLLSSRPVLGTPLKSQANGEEKKEGAPVSCGLSFVPFGLPADSFIKSARCTLPVRHLGPHIWVEPGPTIGGVATLISAPPTTPPHVNKETLSLIHDWTLGGATNPAPAIPIKPACKNPDCVNGWVQVGTGTPSGEGGEDWTVEACSDCGGEEP